MLNLEDFMNIRDLKQQGWSVSANRRRTPPRPQDRAQTSAGRAAALQTGEPGALQDRSIPPLPAGTMGERRPQRPQVAGRHWWIRPRPAWSDASWPGGRVSLGLALP